MHSEAHIGIIGDYDDSKPSHAATNDSIHYIAEHLGAFCTVDWVPSLSLLTPEEQLRLEHFDGIWASHGSPYEKYGRSRCRYMKGT